MRPAAVLAPPYPRTPQTPTDHHHHHHHHSPVDRYAVILPTFYGGSLMTSGLWAIYYFREISGRGPQAIFWVSILMIFAGILLLAIYGPQT